MDSVMLSASADGLQPADLRGFFAGWPASPSLAERLEIVMAADEVVVARDRDGVVIGIATAITDRRFAAYIPLVEVLPEHQGHGVGSLMIEALLERLRACYMIDVVCDDDLVAFYERLGGRRLNAVVWRNRDRLGSSNTRT